MARSVDGGQDEYWEMQIRAVMGWEARDFDWMARAAGGDVVVRFRVLVIVWQ